MRISSKPPGRWRRGQAITAAKLDEPGAVLRELQRGIVAPRQVNPGAASSAPEVRRFKIKEILQDYMQCAQWDGVKEGPVTYVAKPLLLRASATTRVFTAGTLTFSDATSTGSQRVATLDATSETQVVVPEYVVDDEIIAIRNIRGKTGLTRMDAGVEKDVEWLDMNTDARAWAKQA